MTSQLMGIIIFPYALSQPQSLGDQSWHSCMLICLMWRSMPVNHMSITASDEGEYS